MKILFSLILCSAILLSSCSALENSSEASSISEHESSSSLSSVSEKSFIPEESVISDEPEIPLSELTETTDIPGNSFFTKVEISCSNKLLCYALTDSGNLYRFDYTDESMECIRSGVSDFWEGSFYSEPNIVFKNGWIFAAGEYFYKPDLTAVAGDFFLSNDGKIEYIQNGEWKTFETNAKMIKAQQPDSLYYTDSENNLFIFTKYIEEPIFLAENVIDYGWNFFDKLNYAEETIYITEDKNIGIIFDEEFSNPETFLSLVPEKAEKICSSSGNFLFQKADGTYFYGHKSTDRGRDINITGVYADLHYRDYAIIGTDGKIHLHIEELTYFGEAIDDNYTVVKDFIIELP